MNVSAMLIILLLAFSAKVNGEEGFSFQWLGELPGGAVESQAFGVNYDGSVIVGASRSANGLEAFRWTESGGMVGLGDLAGGAFASSARGVSADGTIVAGNGATAAGNEGFRWTLAEGLVSIGDLPGGAVNCQLANISQNGTAIGARGTVTMGSRAMVWTETDGLRNLGVLPGKSSSTVNGVTDEALRAVGNSGNKAFLWSPSVGMVELPTPPNSVSSVANAITPSGSVIVGGFLGGCGRWMNDIPEYLGTLGDAGQLLSVSDNGIAAVGINFDGRPMLWTRSLGLVFLDEYLTEHGVDLNGSPQLKNGTAISRNGSTIVGYSLDSGSDLRAWKATIGFDPTCYLQRYSVTKGIVTRDFLLGTRRTDSDGISIFGDEISLQAEVVLEGYSPVSAPSSLTFHLETAVGRNGVSQQVDMFDFSDGVYVRCDGRIAPTSVSTVSVTKTTDANRFVGPENMLRVRLSWSPINDEDPFQDGWFHFIDVAKWVANP